MSSILRLPVASILLQRNDDAGPLCRLWLSWIRGHDHAGHHRASRGLTGLGSKLCNAMDCKRVWL